jgi:hypothetical protein
VVDEKYTRAMSQIFKTISIRMAKTIGALRRRSVLLSKSAAGKPPPRAGENNTMKPLIALACLSLFPVAQLAHAQAVTHGGAPAEMKKLAFLAGKWEGTGSLRRGPGEQAQAKVTEVATFKLQGSVLLLEGRGVAKTPEGADLVVHDALAVLSFDRVKNRFVIRTYRAGGEMLEPEIEVADRKIIWQFDEPRAGRIRFTLTVGDDGLWREIGEASRDGKNWFPFFGMQLKKIS